MIALQFIGGLLLLILGAEAVVRGATRLAAAAGLSSLVIGLTVVAFGTSAPELAVTVKASLSGQDAVSLGNVVGSNIFNVLAILGLSALITPLVVSSQLVQIDVPLMIGSSLGVFWMASDGLIDRFDGTLLAATLLVYTSVLVFMTRNSESAQPGAKAERRTVPWSLIGALSLVLAGLAMLVGGAQILVDSAVVLASALGVSDVVIGLTIVAVGTSLPEVVTSVVASLRGEQDIAVGNVVGSNLFNLLGVLGAGALVAPHGLTVSSSVLRFDMPVMLAAAIVCLPIFFTRLTIDRWEAALLLVGYFAYLGCLLLAAANHAGLST